MSGHQQREPQAVVAAPLSATTQTNTMSMSPFYSATTTGGTVNIKEVLATIADCDKQLNFMAPGTNDPALRARFTRHMEAQYMRLANVWKMVLTADDFRDLSDDGAALILRASVHAEAECLRSAEDWAAQARHWEGQVPPEASSAPGVLRRPRPSPR